MIDLWTEASYDAEAALNEQRFTAARVAVAPLWSFLAAADGPADYANRKAIVAERIDAACEKLATGADFAVLRNEVESALDEDFSILNEARLREAAKERVALRRIMAETARRQALRTCRECGKAMNPVDAMVGSGSGKAPICGACVRKKQKGVTGKTAFEEGGHHVDKAPDQDTERHSPDTPDGGDHVGPKDECPLCKTEGGEEGKTTEQVGDMSTPAQASRGRRPFGLGPGGAEASRKQAWTNHYRCDLCDYDGTHQQVEAHISLSHGGQATCKACGQQIRQHVFLGHTEWVTADQGQGSHSRAATDCPARSGQSYPRHQPPMTNTGGAEGSRRTAGAGPFEIGDKVRVSDTNIVGVIERYSGYDDYAEVHKYQVRPDTGGGMKTWNHTSLEKVSSRRTAEFGQSDPFATTNDQANDQGARINTLRQIVQTNQATQIDGMLVDIQTANMLVQIHDALNPDNQAKFDDIPLQKLVEWGWSRTKPGTTGQPQAAPPQQQPVARRTAAVEIWGEVEAEMDSDDLVYFDTDKGRFTVRYAPQPSSPDDEGWYPEGPGQRQPMPYEIIDPRGQTISTFYASGDDMYGPAFEAVSTARSIIEKEGRKTAEQHGGYHLEQDGGRWKVVNHIGEVKSTFDSKDKALKYQRALMVNVPGAQESAERHEKSGDEAKHSMRKGAPFADYTDFDDCVSKNSDKDDPEAYCGKIKHETEDKKGSRTAGFSTVSPASTDPGGGEGSGGTRCDVCGDVLYANQTESQEDVDAWKAEHRHDKESSLRAIAEIYRQAGFEGDDLRTAMAFHVEAVGDLRGD